MDADLAFSIAEQAANRGVSVVFSGGEPMIRKPLVLAIARAISGKCRSIAVYSNGYWAKDDATAKQTISEMTRSGINTLLMSTDRFHQPYVQADCVERAARHAIAAGMYCEVSVPTPNNDLSCSDLVVRLKSIAHLQVKVHGLSATGRANELSESVFRRGVHDRPCGVIGELSASPDGFIYCCCAGSIDADSSSRLCLGSAREEPLDVLLDRFEADPVYADIRSSGPIRAAILEHARTASVALPELLEFNDICAACRHCFSRPGTLMGADHAGDNGT
jgi:hypothetical protein